MSLMEDKFVVSLRISKDKHTMFIVHRFVGIDELSHSANPAHSPPIMLHHMAFKNTILVSVILCELWSLISIAGSPSTMPVIAHSWSLSP